MAIEEYIGFMSRGGRGPGGDELRREAKERLLSSGWTFHMKRKYDGRQELRYMAPHGASYISLIVACKKYQQFSFSSTSHPPKSRNRSGKGAAASPAKPSGKKRGRAGSGGGKEADAGGSDEECSTATGPPSAPRTKKRRRVSALYAGPGPQECGLCSRTGPMILRGPIFCLFQSLQIFNPAKVILLGPRILPARPWLYAGDALRKSAAAKKKNASAASRVLQPRPKDGDKNQVVAGAAALVPSSCQPSRARTILTVLMEKNILRPTAKLSYRRTTRGPAVKQGTVTGDGHIRCLCGCGRAFTVAEFAAHAGGKATTERASAHLFVGDRRSLSQCLVQLMRADGRKNRGSPTPSPGARVKRKCTTVQEDGDCVCSVCADGGEMLLCDCCPSAFHHGCVGLDATPQGEWFCPPCRCAICGSGEFEPAPDEFTDKTVICCDQCEREYHVSCIRSRGDQLECCPQGPWLCSQKCSNIFQRLQGLVGRSIPTSVEGLSFTLFRSSQLPEEEAMAAEEHGKLRMAFDVLHECFVTLIEPQTQSDLSHDIVFNRESWLRRLNFRGFYVVGIEKDGELITVGTLRVYGDKVAELPLVGTRFAHRRQGMCHLLMNNLEKLLSELGVERLVLPAVPELLQTWTESFGFQVMSQSDKLEIAEHTILCFQGTTMCHKFINKAVAPRR
ncbi:increased DNA methylation 1-like [Lolium perenne]|uniref:increased DNA methylation 1-like n=1 Tax=Lolium perenne TaxID=4522 RepID=UPI003A993D8D